MDKRIFSGTKIALLCGLKIVAYKRDDMPDIAFPGLSDLPGGGREGSESPIQCGLREVEEEFGITIAEDRVCWIRRYESSAQGGLDTYFCVVNVSPSQIEGIRFGNDGQCWQMMDANTFIARSDAVPHMQESLKSWIDQQGNL